MRRSDTGTIGPLSEGWLFQPDPLRAGDVERWQRSDLDRSGWRPVAVPMAWDHYDPVMDGYEGVGWYAIAIPADRIDPEAWQRLRFGRVNHRAKVWIDGNEAGENLTGYLPFEVAATPWLVDAVTERFGVRSVAADGRRILLNGRGCASAASTATTSSPAATRSRTRRRSAPISRG